MKNWFDKHPIKVKNPKTVYCLITSIGAFGCAIAHVITVGQIYDDGFKDGQYAAHDALAAEIESLEVTTF